MPDETIKYFLEQMIDSLDSISNALCFMLQYYHVTTAEKESLNQAKLINKEEL